MDIVAWILLIFFGGFSLVSTFKFLFGSLNIFHAIMWFISILITALSAGIIWGGLFKGVII